MSQALDEWGPQEGDLMVLHKLKLDAIGYDTIIEQVECYILV